MHGKGLTRHRRLIDGGIAGNDRSVHGNRVTGANDNDVGGFHLRKRLFFHGVPVTHPDAVHFQGQLIGKTC